nr:reverse transcriptase domain-containing protein [Tanacetum cinerariifolium]
MADQRTMAQLLHAPTEGYEDAIVVPAITTDNFKFKHCLFILVQNKQFFGHDKEDPHAHVRYFNKITSTLKFSNISNTSIKLMLFPFSLEGAARIWLEKEPPRSIFTWDDLVLKFINQFFPPSKTTNLRNENTNFQQRFDESFSEAWDRLKDPLRACPPHDKMPRECLAIIKSKSKVFYSRNEPVVAKVGMNTSTFGISPDVAKLKDMVKALLLDKKSQSPAPMKAVEESCITYGGAHSYRNCPATDDNAPAYQAPAPQTQGISKEDFSANVKANDAVMRNMQTQVLTCKPVTSPISEPVIVSVSAPKPNPKTSTPYPSRRNEERNREKANNQIEKFYQIFKDMSFRISFVDALILMPKFASILKALIGNKEKLSEMAQTPLNEHCSAVLLKKLPKNLGDPDRSFRISFVDALILMPKFASILKALIGNKEKLSEMAQTPLNEHCSAVLLKKLPKNLGDPGTFLIPRDYPGMAECLALADLSVSINLMPFSMRKRLSLPDLIPTCMTLEPVDRSISHPVGVAEDVYVKVGSFHFPADFVIVDFDADPRVPLILGRSFLKTERALIDVFEEVDGFLAIADEPTSPKFYLPYLDPEGDILLLEVFLNDDPSPPPSRGNYLPEVHKELKIDEAKSDKSLVDKPQRFNSRIYLPTSNMNFW